MRAMSSKGTQEWRAKSHALLQHSITVLLISLSCLGHAWAQTGGRNAGTPNAGGRVARVQYLLGEVSIASNGTNHWVAAALNLSLTTNTDIWADKNSRAELNVGDGFIRLNSETSLTLANVSRGTVQFRVNQGSVSLTVQRLMSGEIYEIDTPNGTFTIMKPGVYRADVDAKDDQTSVTVRHGSMAATGQGGLVTINSTEQVRFRNDESLQHTSEKAPPPDGFDDWARVRDQRLGGPRRAPYFAVGVLGLPSWGIGAIYGPSIIPPGPPPFLGRTLSISVPTVSASWENAR